MIELGTYWVRDGDPPGPLLQVTKRVTLGDDAMFPEYYELYGSTALIREEWIRLNLIQVVSVEALSD